MTNKRIAESALRTIRQKMKAEGVRSSNKRCKRDTEEEVKLRRDTYTLRATVVWAKPKLPAVGAKELFDDGIANCTDLAWLAAEEFPNGTPHSLVRAGVDHVFVAVGVDFELSPVTKDPASWQPNSTNSGAVYICDPWADIAAAAEDYADRWDEQMRQWQKDGKKIGVSGGKWVEPTTWVGLIRTSEKATVTSQGEPSYGDSDSDSGQRFRR